MKASVGNMVNITQHAMLQAMPGMGFGLLAGLPPQGEQCTCGRSQLLQIGLLRDWQVRF